MGLINRYTVALLHGWNYSNFCKHLNGAGCSMKMAKEYAEVLGGSTDPWLLPNKSKERQLIYNRYISKQINAFNKKCKVS